MPDESVDVRHHVHFTQSTQSTQVCASAFVKQNMQFLYASWSNHYTCLRGYTPKIV